MTEPEHSNFDLLRVFAVVLVIYGNGLVLTGVPASGLWGAPFARIGIDLLFAISGYLALSAWARAGGLRPYLERRAWRVMPGLLACVLVTIVVIGPLATTLPLHWYILNSGTRAYLANAVFLLKLWLPGVFVGQQWAGAVNAMLWTLLPGALLLALATPLIAALPRRARLAVPLAAGTACAAAALLLPNIPELPPVLLVRIRSLVDILTEIPFFLAGTALYALELAPRHASRPHPLWRADLAMFCFAANWTTASWLGEWDIVLEWLTLPYMAVCFGRMRLPGLDALRHLGNPSYGMFLFAFPLQQLIVARWPGNPQPILTATALAFAAGLLSWHLIEHPALRHGPAILRRRFPRLRRA